MPKSDSKAAVPERHRSLEKKKEIGRIGRERYSRRDREMPERAIYDFNAIYKVAELAMYARVQ
jgi:hypothetical protein